MFSAIASTQVAVFALWVSNQPWIAASASNSESCCRFARAFQNVNWRDERTQNAFISHALAAERNFFAAADVGYDNTTGMTYDGFDLDADTGSLKVGDIYTGARTVSASSKESVQISLLALSLLPQEPDSPVVYTTEETLDILEKKVSSMEDFDRRYPGYGGFLPWICPRGANGDVMSGAPYGCRLQGLNQEAGPVEPASGWLARLPGLDNGQLAWATYAVARALSERASGNLDSQELQRTSDLARRWSQRLERMKASAVPLFYEGAGSGLVREEAGIFNLSADVAGNPTNSYSIGPPHYYLVDPFEGELMVVFMDLIADWSGYPDNGAREKELMWSVKQGNVKAVNYTTKTGEVITVQQGFWFSSHEQWKIMVLPYLQIPFVRQIFANCERVRVINAIENLRPGLQGSCTAPSRVQCGTYGGYCNAVGIAEVAAQPVLWTQQVSPYGAYPTILIDKGSGLAWYNAMLSLPHMQTKHGSVEASDVTGTSIAPVLTWDTKSTTVLAMLGGTGPLIRRHLETEGLLSRFEAAVSNMYSAEFQGRFVSSSEEPLPLPPQQLESQLQLFAGGELLNGGDQSDFGSCSCSPSVASSLSALFVEPDVHV